MTNPQSFQTMCPMNCHPTLCGMKVTVRDDALDAITGDPDNPDSRGFLCMRGNAAHEIVGNPGRVLTPMARRDPVTQAWQDTDWDSALDLIAAHMRAAGPAAVGVWQGHGNAVNDYGVGLKRGQTERFANLYGAQFWNPAMICWGMGGFGLGLTGALETSTKEDMGDHSDLILLWGANTVSQANTMKHVERAKRRGAHVVVIDVRRTEASALADDVLLLRPGTDAALALAMMQGILADGAWDPGFIEAHTTGFDRLQTHLGDKTPDWAAHQTGLSVEQITGLARRYASTKRAMIVIGGSSMHKGGNSWHAARAISCLPALTGSFGQPGGGIGPRHGARSHGAGFTDIGAADQRPPGPVVPNQIEAIVEALETGQIKVLFAPGANVLSSFPDTERVRAALRRADLVVAYDIFDNSMIRDCAHVVLPGTIWLEEIGAKATNTHVHLCEPALPPAGQARPLYQVYRDLAVRLDVADFYPWESQEAALNAVLDHPATGHATVQDLRDNGGRVALDISHVAYPTLEFHTPSGQIEFYSHKARDLGLPPLPEAPERAATDALTLAHGRTFAHFHGFYDHGRAIPTLAAREEAPALWIAPTDATSRGIGDGDAITLSNPRGTFQAVAKVTRRIPAGTVWIHDGWPGLNALTDGQSVLPVAALTAFPFSVGQPGFGAEVAVTRAAAP